MAKKNIFLLLIAAVMSISFILDAKLESSLNSNQFYGYNLAAALVFNFLFFAWCVEHAKYHNVEPPLTLSIILLGPLGILIYFFRRFGFKKGLSNTFKSMGFVFIVGSSVVWVAENLMVKESVQEIEVNKITDGKIYDLLGREVTEMNIGQMYLRDNKKFIRTNN